MLYRQGLVAVTDTIRGATRCRYGAGQRSAAAAIVDGSGIGIGSGVACMPPAKCGSTITIVHSIGMHRLDFLPRDRSIQHESCTRVLQRTLYPLVAKALISSTDRPPKP